MTKIRGKKKEKKEIPSNFIHKELSLYMSCSRNISEGLSNTGGCRVSTDTLTSFLRPDSMVSQNQKRLLREKTRLPWPSVSLLLVVIKWKSSADLHFQNLVHKSLTGQADTFSIQGSLLDFLTIDCGSPVWQCLPRTIWLWSKSNIFVGFLYFTALRWVTLVDWKVLHLKFI